METGGVRGRGFGVVRRGGERMHFIVEGFYLCKHFECMGGDGEGGIPILFLFA